MKKGIIVLSVLAAALITAGCNTTESSRNLADPTVPGKVLAQQACSLCHGVDGNSLNPTFPKLAGQQHWYIVEELKEFQTHDRSDSVGQAYMWGPVRKLTDKQMTELADYFSAQKNVPSVHENAALLAQGKDIFTNGLPAQGTPACAICHGADGAGSATFPRIAGQHADYMYKQIRVFKDTNDRPRGAVMKGITQALTPEQIKAVTTYVSTL